MKHLLLLLLSGFILSSCSSHTLNNHSIGYGLGIGGATTNSNGAGVYTGATVENEEIRGMIAIDSGFIKI